MIGSDTDRLLLTRKTYLCLALNFLKNQMQRINLSVSDPDNMPWFSSTVNTSGSLRGQTQLDSLRGQTQLVEVNIIYNQLDII